MTLGVVSMPHAALWVVQQRGNDVSLFVGNSFNAARGFVGGAAENLSWLESKGGVSMPHAALWVVQRG